MDGTPLIVTLPRIAQAEESRGRRYVYFETSREGVIDRQGEDIAADALWNSRDVFLGQGNIDINHFSWLGSPYGTGPRPEYVIGLPSDVKRKGPSIYVKAEIFSSKTPPPPGSSGDWADWFWHSVTGMSPTMQWFPSVFGAIPKGSAQTVIRDGKQIRYITKTEWYSVGLAQRAQHPALGAVSAAPMDVFAKAAGAVDLTVARASGAIVLPWHAFAKAAGAGGVLMAGDIGTDTATRTGAGALTPTSLEGAGYGKFRKLIMRDVLKKRIKPDRDSIAKAFTDLGCDPVQAHAFTKRLLIEASGN